MSLFYLFPPLFGLLKSSIIEIKTYDLTKLKFALNNLSTNVAEISAENKKEPNIITVLNWR